MSSVGDSRQATKNPHCPQDMRAFRKGGQADLNRRPPDPQSGEASFKQVKAQRVAKRRSRRGSSGGSSSTENERGEAVGESVSSKVDSFSAALMLIASLPLSDAEKADAVRRLMAERAKLGGDV